MWIRLNYFPLPQYTYKLNKQILFVVATIFFGLIMGLRDVSVGTDTVNYVAQFNTVCRTQRFDIIGLNRRLDIEYGYILYLKLISLLSHSPTVYLLITSFLICGLLFKFLYDNSKTPLLSILIILPETFLLGFNIQRQILATVFVLTAWTLVTRHKYLKSLFLVLLAFSFHLTTVFALPIFAVYIFRKSKFIVRIIPLIFIMFLISFNMILSVFAGNEIYANYMNNHKAIHQAGGIMLIWGIELFVCIYQIYFFKVMSFVRVWAVIGCVYVITNLIGLEFNYFERLGSYYLPFLSLSLPMIVYKFKGRIQLIAKICIGLLFFIYFTMSVGGQYNYSFSQYL